jgi:hypothetical protein
MLPAPSASLDEEVPNDDGVTEQPPTASEREPLTSLINFEDGGEEEERRKEPTRGNDVFGTAVSTSSLRKTEIALAPSIPTFSHNFLILISSVVTA